MSDLTKADWNLINDALALYEASAGDLMYEDERKVAALEAKVASVRTKVWERLEPGRRTMRQSCVRP